MTGSNQDEGLAQPLLKPERQQQAKEYARTGRYLTYAELTLAGSLLILLVFGGLSVKLTGYFNLPVVAAAVIYFVILIAVYGVFQAPISYYRGYVLPRRYGLSSQSVTGWLSDLLKAGALVLALGTAIIAASYWFISIVPQLWWLLAWILLVLISLVLSVLAPIILVPLFYRMKPLEDASLKDRFKQLAGKADAYIKDVYTLDFSSKGTAANAALMGMGKTKRIALSDTLLEKYSTEEIEVIIAHELGHHKNRDFVRIFFLQAAILFISFWLTHVITKMAVTPLGFSGIDDIAVLPLLVLVFAVLSLLLMPISNTFVRQRERAADDFALRITANPQAFISMIAKLTDQNLAEAEPARWVELLLYDHPSYRSRVAHARDYPSHGRVLSNN